MYTHIPLTYERRQALADLLSFFTKAKQSPPACLWMSRSVIMQSEINAKNGKGNFLQGNRATRFHAWQFLFLFCISLSPFFSAWQQWHVKESRHRQEKDQVQRVRAIWKWLLTVKTPFALLQRAVADLAFVCYRHMTSNFYWHCERFVFAQSISFNHDELSAKVTALMARRRQLQQYFAAALKNEFFSHKFLAFILSLFFCARDSQNVCSEEKSFMWQIFRFELIS